MKRWLWLLFFGCAFSALARTGIVQTEDGSMYLGSIRLERDRLIIANVAQASLIPVEARTLRRASFERTPSPPPDSIMVRQSWTDLPDVWRHARIGGEPSPGNWRGGLFGIEVHEGKQEFIHQKLGRRAELVVRVLAVPSEGPSDASAGLMFRESVDPAARMVYLGMSSRHRGILQWRDQPGAPVRSAPLRAMAPPYWIRIKRDDNAITTYRSSLGDRWTLIERIEIPFEEEILVGLAAAGGEHEPGDPRRAGTALLDNVRVGRSVPLSSFVPRAGLCSGSIVSGEMQSADGQTITFPGPLPRPTLQVSDVAYLQFQWLSPEAREGIEQGRAGVYLVNGEFVEGEFRGMDAERIRISSILFGLKSYDINNEVMAISMQPANPAQTPYEVATADGSEWRATSLEIGEHEVLIREPSLGQVRLAAHNLLEIRRNAGR